jgi:hypothetical protein
MIEHIKFLLQILILKCEVLRREQKKHKFDRKNKHH